MNQSDVLALLKRLEPRLRGVGVAGLYLYGSYARDEGKSESDVDVLVEFDPAVKPDLVSYTAPYVVLEQAFGGIRIGFSTREGLNPLYRPYVEPTLVRVF
jgi:predicted nucleotidyltransferase